MKKELKQSMYEELRKECLSGHYVERLEAMAEIVHRYNYKHGGREYRTIQQLKAINHDWQCLFDGTYETYKTVSGMLEFVLRQRIKLNKKQMNGLHYAFLDSGTTPLKEDVTDDARSNG